MLDEAYELVKEFKILAEQPVREQPCFLDKDTCVIRCKWMKEEIEELIQGKNEYEQADAIIDLIYYALGFMVEIGIKPDELFMLIHKYNMKKLQKISWNKEGKVQKSADWVHPDQEIKKIIDNQR